MTARTPAGDKGTTDRIEADDGAFWVRLITWQALGREGEAMDHCVGDGAYHRFVGGEEMTDDAIWALRRANGVSVLTVRIEGSHLNYARGFSNHPPGRGASLQVRHLIAAFEAAGMSLTICPSTRIVAVPDGRTFRDDRIPPVVQAAMDEEQRRVRERQAAVDTQRPRVRLGQARSSLMPVRESVGAAVAAALDTQLDIPVRFASIRISTDENPTQPLLLQSPQGFVDAYLRYVMSEPPRPRSGSDIGVWSAPQVERDHIYEIAPIGTTTADET